MIQVILGDKGSGKTKRLIDLANDALKQEHGNIIFLFHVHLSFQLSFLRRYSLKKSMTTTTTNSDSRTVPRLL